MLSVLRLHYINSISPVDNQLDWYICNQSALETNECLLVLYGTIEFIQAAVSGESGVMRHLPLLRHKLKQ